jgi:DNA polymerase-3 subunit gamma/tau
LINQIKSKQISHAYLFCGSHGTGKTSIAKIFAMALNCESNNDGEPCNKCHQCLNTKNKSNINIIEIDAASNNSVDNIRDLCEEIKYPPVDNSRYKIYIIDEIHMLSSGAFNALLKTLEEPPKYIVFILATTEYKKIPTTIISRCQRYDFKKICDKDIFVSLKNICEQEEIIIDYDALEYISEINNGSLRDAISVLDRCSNLYRNKRINLKDILDFLSVLDFETCDRFINELENKNLSSALEIIDSFIDSGKDSGDFIYSLIFYLYKSIKKDINNKNDIEFKSNILENFVKLDSKLKYLINKRLALDLLIIDLCE